jgi:hypothetical protein
MKMGTGMIPVPRGDASTYKERRGGKEKRGKASFPPGALPADGISGVSLPSQLTELRPVVERSCLSQYGDERLGLLATKSVRDFSGPSDRKLYCFRTGSLYRCLGRKSLEFPACPEDRAERIPAGPEWRCLRNFSGRIAGHRFPVELLLWC